MDLTEIKKRNSTPAGPTTGQVAWLIAEVERLTDLIYGEHGLDARLTAADDGWSQWQIKATEMETQVATLTHDLANERAEVERLQGEFNKAAQIIINAAESASIQEKAGQDFLDENLRLRAEVERLKGERDEAHRIMGEFIHKSTMDTALSLGVGQLKGHIDFLEHVIIMHMAAYRKAEAERDKYKGIVDAVELALRDNHYALDMRQHDGLAADAALAAIEKALGLPWSPQAERKRRSAEAVQS